MKSNMSTELRHRIFFHKISKNHPKNPMIFPPAPPPPSAGLPPAGPPAPWAPAAAPAPRRRPTRRPCAWRCAARPCAAGWARCRWRGAWDHGFGGIETVDFGEDWRVQLDSNMYLFIYLSIHLFIFRGYFYMFLVRQECITIMFFWSF